MSHIAETSQKSGTWNSSHFFAFHAARIGK